MTTYKLGKLPARPGAVKFSLADYVDLSALPVAPAVFGHSGLVPAAALGMLGNDQYGDCVFAGAGHETLLWNAAQSVSVTFTDATALADYSAVTGFNPADPNSDQGTDMAVAAKYRRKTGVIDAAGKRHTVGAYVSLPGVSARGANAPSLLDNLARAAYTFEAVGIGIEFPASAMDQFNAGQPWDVVEGSAIDGGHYVPLVGRAANGNFIVVSWGAYQEVTPAFLLKYVDEAIVYFSAEFLNGQGVSLEGFDVAALNADIVSLGGTPAPFPEPQPVPVPTPVPVPVPPVPAPPVPAPTPAPVGPSFPINAVVPFLEGHHIGKARVAAQAIIKWLNAGGQ